MVRSPTHFDVLLTQGAEQDLEAIHDYIRTSDGITHANRVLDALMTTVLRLSAFPERGSIPKELAALGSKDYRQVLFKPYRAIYRVSGKQVVIHIIADGRRDMQSLLAKRVLGR